MASQVFRLFLSIALCASSCIGYCQGLLPVKLEGEVFLFQDGGVKLSDSSDAGSQFLMHFGRSGYVYQVIGSEQVLQGKYRYIRKLAKNGIEVGLLASEEVFEGGEVSYEMVLMPDDESVGMYLFKQNVGPLTHESRLNAGRFTRVTRLFEVGLKRRCGSLSDSGREDPE
ncbi:hypothetical protein [Endozoicomonas elysicola]|uniref:Uncharacterized protein n=1 Tax=Endozoicomonas elysicola TaxID=305900 RepID=A0A081KDW5_9GAMM|nr:hypothetical protein [Endozoicomonas elysicola]KEI72341.1 hypothetical protein GV64_17840 [Endozoicomonas elysicola]